MRGPKIFLLLTLALCGFQCRPTEKNDELKLSGTLELTEYGVGAQVPGRIVTLNVDEGSVVKKGELIALLDRYEQNSRDYQRLSQLLSHGGSNEQAVEQARLAMEDQRIASPVDGVVLTKAHELGEVVGTNSPIVVLGDRSKIWIRVFVPEGQINRVQMGQAATVQLDGLSKAYTGHVSFIAPKAEFTPRNVQTPEERVTQTFSVKVTLDAPDPNLRPGVAADVSLNLMENKP